MRKEKCIRCKYKTALWRIKGLTYCSSCVEDVKCKASEIVNLNDERSRQLEERNKTIDKMRSQNADWKVRTRTNSETAFKYPVNVLSTLGEN